MFLIFGVAIIEKLEKGTTCLREGKEIFFLMFYVICKSWKLKMILELPKEVNTLIL